MRRSTMMILVARFQSGSAGLALAQSPAGYSSDQWVCKEPGSTPSLDNRATYRETAPVRAALDAKEESCGCGDCGGGDETELLDEVSCLDRASDFTPKVENLDKSTLCGASCANSTLCTGSCADLRTPQFPGTQRRVNVELYTKYRWFVQYQQETDYTDIDEECTTARYLPGIDSDISVNNYRAPQSGDKDKEPFKLCADINKDKAATLGVGLCPGTWYVPPTWCADGPYPADPYTILAGENWDTKDGYVLVTGGPAQKAGKKARSDGFPTCFNNVDGTGGAGFWILTRCPRFKKT